MYKNIKVKRSATHVIISKEKNILDKENTKYCSKCNTRIAKNALYCFKCGKSIYTEIRFCQYCSKEKLKEANFCHICGNLITALTDYRSEYIKIDNDVINERLKKIK